MSAPASPAAKARNFADIPHVRDAGFIKAGRLTKLRADGSEKARWDYALCGKLWFKLSPDKDTIRWQEEYTAIHAVEEDLEHPKHFHCWVYKGGKKTGAGGYPSLCRRALMCENEGERDDWVATFRALLMNYWHERLEQSLIPAPEVYQFHIFVMRHGDAASAPHLLALSTAALRLVLLRTPTDSETLLHAGFAHVTKLQRSSSQPKLVALHTAGAQPMVMSLKDSLEVLTVIAEVNRLVKLETSNAVPVEVVSAL